MKILIVGSNGRVGHLAAQEALNKNLDVTGLGKGDNKNKNIKYIQKDALDLTSNDLDSFDVIVDAVGGWTPESIPNITNVMIHLADILENSDKRLIVVGGAGSLFVDRERKITVDMGKDFPDSWKPLSKAHSDGLDYLRKTKNVIWTYVSPACNFVADGKKTGEYKLGKEELILNSKGESTISYADYALALVDIILSQKYFKERISAVSK